MSSRSYPGEPALCAALLAGVAKNSFVEGEWERLRYSWSKGRVALVLASLKLDFGFNPRAEEMAWDAHGQGNVT